MSNTSAFVNNGERNGSSVPNFDSVLTTSFVINYLDYVVRIGAIIVHAIYLFLMFKIKKFRSRTYFFMHNVIIISFVYCLHYVFYIGTGGPAFKSLELNLIFCYLSEQIWSIVKYLRAFSILLLAFYRLVAVLSITLYKKLNNGRTFILISIAVSWLFSIILTFAIKYALNTTYSVYFCSPGYSDSVPDMVIAFVLNIFLSNIIPTVINLWVYLKIVKKLKTARQNLNKNKSGTTSLFRQNNKVQNSSGGGTITRLPNETSYSTTATAVFTTTSSALLYTNNNKQKKDMNSKQVRFAKQFILMNIFIVLSNILSVMVDFLIVLATNPAFLFLDQLLWEVRPIVRILFLVFQSFIPIISIIYNPEVKCFTFFQKLKYSKVGFYVTVQLVN